MFSRLYPETGDLKKDYQNLYDRLCLIIREMDDAVWNIDYDNIVKDGITSNNLRANCVTAGKVDADAISAREIQADSITTAHIQADAIDTSKLTIHDEDGMLNLSGSYLIMRDYENTKRLVFGSTGSGTFVFYLNNADGEQTIFIDSDGNAIFSGEVRGGKITSDTDINVTTDLHVGDNVYIGDQDDRLVQKMIRFSGGATITALDDEINISTQRLKYNNKHVATEIDIEGLSTAISNLENRVRVLENGAGV